MLQSEVKKLFTPAENKFTSEQQEMLAEVRQIFLETAELVPVP